MNFATIVMITNRLANFYVCEFVLTYNTEIMTTELPTLVAGSFIMHNNTFGF